MADIIDQERALEHVTERHEILEFDYHLTQLQTRIRRERIALLANYLDRGAEIHLEGSIRSVEEKVVRTEDSLELHIANNIGKYVIVAESRDAAQKIRNGLLGSEDTQSIDAITLPSGKEEFKAEAYPILCQLAAEVAALRRKNKDNLVSKQGGQSTITYAKSNQTKIPFWQLLRDTVKDTTQTKKQRAQEIGRMVISRAKAARDSLQEKDVRYNDFGFEAYLTEQLAEQGVQGFGGYTELFRRQYRRESRKDFRHAATGAALTAILLAIATMSAPTPPPQDGMSNPGAMGDGQIPDDMKNEDGKTKWSPDGKPLPKPGKKGKPTDGGGGEDSLDEMQKKYLHSLGGSEPERMKDIRKHYLKLTYDIEVKPKTKRHDLSKPEDYFVPGKLVPFPLKDRAVEMKKPTREKPERSILVILDCTSSMGNPEDILIGKPSLGYYIATQTIKSGMSMGATVRVMKYPVLEATDTAIFDATSMDAALEELLYNSGGAYDAQAVEQAATVYLTIAQRKGLPPMDVVFITDAGPTYDGALNFMDLEEKIRDKDQIYWVNTLPLPDAYPAEERKVRVGTKKRNKKDKDREYLPVDTLKKARRASERIIKQYQK